MSFADPQSVTINAVATSLPRVGNGTPTSNSYRSADGNIELTIRQNTTANRFRREFRLTQKKIAADPFDAVNHEVSTSVILTVDEPKWGFTDVEIGYLTDAVKTAFTNAVRDKLLGGEM